MHKHLRLHDYFHFSQITEMYLGIALRSLAISLVGIFIPIILLTNNYAFVDVLLYYASFSIIAFVTFLIGVELMRFIGVKHVMLLNVPFLVFFFYLIYSIGTQHWSVFFLSAVHATSGALFWSAFHIEFSAASSKKRSGSQISYINIITQSLSLVTPLLGGAMLLVFGEAGIALLSGSFALLSGIPLLLARDHKIKAPFGSKDLFYKFSFRRIVAFMSEGVRNYAAIVIWPTYISVMGLGFLAIGSLYTIVRVVLIISSYFVGKLSDKHNPKKILRFGTIAHSVSLALRGFMETAGSFTAITSFGGFGFITFNVPLQKLWYSSAKTLGPLFVIRREFYLDFGRLVLIVIALFIYGLTQSIFITSIVCFFIGAIATLLLNFIE